MDEEFGDGTGYEASPPQTTPQGQRHDRNTSPGRNAQFLTPTRHGEAYRDPESGNLSPNLSPNLQQAGRSRSGSMRLPSTSPLEAPLRRAGTVMKNLSQRVVNLSNEPEVAEKNIKRSPSIGQLDYHSPATSRPASPGLVGINDGTASIRSPVHEKLPSPIRETPIPELPIRPPGGKPPNPLRGKSLGIFGPENPFRRWLLEVLTHPVVEPTILILIILQVVLLVIDAAPNVFYVPRANIWGSTWIDLAMLVLFGIYSVEILAKVVVSGFIINPVEFSTINRDISFRKAVVNKANDLFSVHRKDPTQPASDPGAFMQQPAPLIRTFTTANIDGVPGSSRQAARHRLAYRAFLRHSFNRLDFLAVVSFWISFWIAVFGFESKQHLYVFRMLSCLRILRLLGITGGTLVILRSLKRAMPILLNVAFLIGFFWLLFAIIGLQSFKSSLRRTCVWTDPNNGTGSQPSYTQNLPGQYQFCGGWLSADGTQNPYIKADGYPAWDSAKGYICPINSKCVEGINPYNNTVSFDNLPQALEMVFVVMTSNTFSDIMYYLTDANYLLSALFFAAGILFLTLWLLNLLIAVITSSFQIIREESRASAFAAEQRGDHAITHEDELELAKLRKSSLQRFFDRTRLFWIGAIVFGLIAQGFQSATMSAGRAGFIQACEVIITLLLDLEIIIRFCIDWRRFFISKANVVDLFLAIATSVIQIPLIRWSGRPYAWLTIFQILRIYRVVTFVPFTRDLIMVVLGNFSGLANLILFVFLLTFLAAIFASQLFRGEIPGQDASGNTIQTPFFSFWNSFLGMYQILSSENWTTMLYNATSYQVAYNNGWIGAAFLILWYILANFVVLNMFIAVIQENFDVSEDEKRLQQVKAFLQQKRFVGTNAGFLSLSSIFKLGNARKQDPLDFGTAATEMLLKDAVVKDFLDESTEAETAQASKTAPPRTTSTPTQNRPRAGFPGATSWRKLKSKLFSDQPNPFDSRLHLTIDDQEVDPRVMAQELVKAAERRKVAQREYLRNHPKFNKSLYMFPPGNPIRRFCQKIVGPGSGGDRIQGPSPSAPIWFAFSAFIYAAIVAMVLLACVTTPLYQKEYFEKHGYETGNWFVYTDIGFAALFTVEMVIKVIADGFYWTPNAYFHSSWGMIDGVVLITLWINVVALLYDPGSGSRAVGAFKALRALRLLNVSSSARDTFHSVMITGIWKVISAAFVSLSLLIPFALYGLNLFSGQMMSCNDNQSGIYNLTDCVNEYMSSPYEWNVLAPRAPSNSYYSFDNFGDSLFILFQIVSQEGWIDVMWSSQGITGVFTQPSYFASQGNTVFFVVFNLLGAVFVLTLFVSVFMRNYTEQTGVAFLTTDQRSWLELRKLLRQISPSKRPSSKKQRKTWREWCYKRAIKKNGKWQRMITALLILHLALLCLEWYPDFSLWLFIRACMFALMTLIYVAHVVIRVIGLSWQRFRKSAWDVYALIAVTGSVVTTCIYWTSQSQRDYDVVYKMSLVSIALLLIPRNNQLDQLFKTAAASLTAILNLLATWFVLFLVFALALTQAFGLTRFGANEKPNLNFRTMPKALIFLFRTSMGEGWNQLMHDFATIEPPFCTIGDRYFDGDCGSEQWAQSLFIMWNIISMYIFVNLFVSLIYESFSYVYQRSNGLSVISREEIRRFKQAWAEHDPEGTGYISKAAFPRLLGELSGVFEMRIYDGDFTVRSLLSDCATHPNRRMTTSSLDTFGARANVDISRLNARLADLPVEEIRRRRQRMNIFYEEVLVSADPDRGIEFTTLLLILAHYKIIHDSRSLRLDEFLRRRARLQRVDEAVRRNVVVGFFDTLYWSRRFRRRVQDRKSARMTAVPSHDFAVPEIFVQDETASPQAIDDPGFGPKTPVLQQSGDGQSDLSPASSRHHSPTAMATPGSSVFASPSSHRHSRADSNVSPNTSPTRLGFRSSPRSHASEGSDTGEWHLSAALTGPFDDTGLTSERRATATGADLDPPRSQSFSRERASSVNHQGMMDVLDNSVWGESIRRSFTLHRDRTMRQRSLASDSGRPSLGSRQNSMPDDDIRNAAGGAYRRLS
ncbi:calcium channel-like protein subunit Cch1 [Myriangium duriaei CBS 260.36]|uniref:Calcium-channel protein CCH1 n=1 Tax=Myriangium duriaei CBS 260.36 TaxID=1168546 RepID=A0A9P4J7V7_9PEZI|nr:calcium channel-like protein subunit Cch1 [Myriangium duriaei CBS 260.36]